ncbi:UbiA family prenyltransferase [Candidatus Woesearchaeota archaeon]|nr:UbiA family prenyltransferase [Candidatus Woesearchaeota archaeon]
MKDYITLIKFKYHASFLAIATIAFFFSGMSVALAQKLVLLYVSFNLLLYTGLYMLNDIADRKEDQQHPFKRHRPIPSGRIPLRTAIALAVLLIATGLFTGWFFIGKWIVGFYFAFIALNITYSFFAKHLPYVEIIMNAATHPLRAVMAFELINHPVQAILVTAYAFFILGLMTIRRVVEKDIRGWEVRRAIRHYSKQALLAIKIASFLIIAALAILDSRGNWPLYALMLGLYTILVFGMYHAGFIRSLLRTMLTK